LGNLIGKRMVAHVDGGFLQRRDPVADKKHSVYNLFDSKPQSIFGLVVRLCYHFVFDRQGNGAVEYPYRKAD